MIKSKICIVAEGVIRDVQTNGISVYSILEELTVQGFPVFIQKIAFFALWEKEENDPGQYRTTFTIELDDKSLMSQGIDLDFQRKLRSRSMVSINGLMVPKPGNLVFSMKVKDGPEAEYQIIVRGVDGSIQAIPDTNDSEESTPGSIG